ncbi:class I SAM-dependent RNA methyltransferase [Sporolactobacillus shoreicorticis]|uniref:Class I SAM-dependent RNA methyltransferase n=1 Tax=Sporolactobacillus shoreicorticis TaxID=1923877 RepID=A0ABW5S6L7_9BACL|nr:class I SAM-dependent RNA methyltransferase [Sporolactobacillus shoreicorticis]MCO7125735.1 class I SAM-dependent RNA methyltransferase [Sporolactobacillus shoreicorticis]
MSEKWTLIATAAMGLEAIAARELRSLGYKDLKVENGRILFSGGPLDICRCNLWLRTADRIRLQIGAFKADTFDNLFEQTKALPWAEILPRNAMFPVIGKSHKSILHSVPDCQAIVKKAIVESMKQHYNQEWFDEDGPMFKIQIALEKDWVTLAIDTSGDGLHKRGYRQLHNLAPLKETLASALILLSRWNPNQPFVDPFCGSGTLPIEAAMIGQNIAPGFNRDFVSESWPIIASGCWEQAREEAESMANYDQPLMITGSDIDHKMIELSEHNALEAGFNGLITFKQMQVADFTTKDENGCMIGNPPYGERMGDRQQIQMICRDLGELFQTYKLWSFYFISSFEKFENFFGRPASKKRKLYNGRIRTDFYQYFGKKYMD